MRRRQFITLLGGTAAIWPFAVRAQQSALPVIGYLSGASAVPFASYVAAFRQGLGDAGYVEARNVAIEYRWADNQPDRLSALAADLVRRQVAVIVTSGGPASTVAAKAATTTIPIVFISGGDPVERGFVASLSRPGGNLTGVFNFTTALEAKRLGLLRELIPAAATVGVLLNPKTPNAGKQLNEIREAARAVGQQIQILNASSDRELDRAFESLAQLHARALLVGSDPFFNSRRDYIVALAARHAMPAIYEWREFAVAGGLMSYGTSVTDSYRQVGIYAGRVLKGEKPGDLPVMQSTRFEFVINLKTAKTLGLEVSHGLSTRADEVIE
jgi:putative ABC transport system substrate-binding protein